MTLRSRRLLAHTLLLVAFVMIAVNLYALVAENAPAWMRTWAVPGMFLAIAASRLYRRSPA